MKVRSLIASMLILILIASGAVPLSAQVSGEKSAGKKTSVQAAGTQDAPQAFGRSAKLATETVKKKAVWPWIVGGVLVAGGVLAYFLLRDGKDNKNSNGNPPGPTTGSVQVNSTPQGARVYLDGVDTGKVTNCLLPNLAQGSHAVKLVKEGFADAESTFEIAANTQAKVDIDLKPYLVTVSSPEQSDSYALNETITIRWNTKAPSAPPAPGAPDPQRLLDINGVRIELIQGGAPALTLAENTPNDGEFEWKITASTPTHHTSAIRVSCATDSSVSGQSGSFALTATKLIRLEYDGDYTEFTHASTRGNLYPVRSYLAGRIECVRYSVQLGEWQNTVDLTAYLEAPNKSQIKIFDRDKSQWYWKVWNPMDSDHLLDLNGTTNAFNGSDAKGDWTLQIQVHDAYCGDRGGCGRVRHFWVEIEITLNP